MALVVRLEEDVNIISLTNAELQQLRMLIGCVVLMPPAPVDLIEVLWAGIRNVESEPDVRQYYKSVKLEKSQF